MGFFVIISRETLDEVECWRQCIAMTFYEREYESVISSFYLQKYNFVTCDHYFLT